MRFSDRPIAVFDSGVGGISVLRELIRLMPGENYIYFGDSKNAPYGVRSADDVCRLTLKNAEHLYQLGIKALVIACNTATSAAIDILRKTYTSIPVIGIEPALKPAVFAKPDSRVLVIATDMTLREQKFHELLTRYRQMAEIITLPAPGIVEFVERGETESAGLLAYLTALFSPYRDKKIDSVVLGCTHFPFAANAIQKILGADTAVFDGGAGTAKETRRRLMGLNLLRDRHSPGHVTFFNSQKTESMYALCEKLLNL